jgi:hypothetical protein
MAVATKMRRERNSKFRLAVGWREILDDETYICGWK